MSDIDDSRISALYRRTSRSEPQDATDDAVLAAARAAVRGHRRSYLPWATAAALVLGVGIAWQVFQFTPEQIEHVEPPPNVLAEPEISDDVVAPDAAAPVRPRSFSDMPAGGFLELQPKSKAFEDRNETLAPAMAPQSVQQLKRQAIRAESDAKSKPDCEAYWPSDQATEVQWHSLIAEARTAGDAIRIECLQRRYQQLFNKPLPAAVSKPEPDE